MNERQRVFVAIPLSKAVQEGIQQFQDHHRQLERSLRWMPVENLHITLYYLGPVWLRDIGPLCERIGPVLAPSPILELTFHAFTLQPPAKPRMIWAQFRAHERFAELARELATICQPFLLQPKQERKQPIPHVTIARMKRPQQRPVLSSEFTLPALTVRRAELWRSETRPEGATYTPLKVFDFLPA